MKKYVILSICAVLLVISIVCLPMSNVAVKIDNTSGTDEKIQNIDDVEKVLEFIAFGAQRKSVLENDSDFEVSKLGYDDANSSGVAYTSGSFFQTMTMNFSYDGTHINADRSMECHMDENASYYISKGNLSTSYLDSYGHIVFDVEMFFEQSRKLIKINDFRIYGLELVEIPENMRGKWINVTGTRIDSIEDMNREGLTLIRNCISKYKEDGFMREGEIYTLSDELTGDMAVKINLANPENPLVDMTQYYENAEVGKYNFDFRNINNVDVIFDKTELIYDVNDFNWDLGVLGNVF